MKANASTAAWLAKLRALLRTTLAASSHEQWFIVLLAGLVGLYAGLAAGLFSGAIQLVSLAVFHAGSLWRVLAGDPAWSAAFQAELHRTNWNLAFLFVGLLAISLALALDRVVAKSERLELLGPAARRFRLLAALMAAGIGLYYPLIALRTFNQSFGLENGGALISQNTPWFLILLAPALGCWASVFLVRRFTPHHVGHGVTEVMHAIADGGSRIPRAVPFWKGLAAAVCTGAGGSVGREGPMVQIGSGIGSAIGQRVGLSPSNLTVLVGSGAAAGIAASFNAPIAGAMFALEIVLGDFGVRTFTPIVFASVMGTMTARTLLARGNEVTRASYAFVSSVEIFPYAALGILCGLLSIAYMVSMEISERFFQGRTGTFPMKSFQRLSPAFRAGLGGLGVGVLGLASPRLLGTGYETMNGALRGELPGLALAGICLGKILATPLTLGSGAQGGSFFPATFIGATGGGAFGAMLHSFWPAHSGFRGAYALVGMGAVAAAATQGPLTGILMMFELTGDYEIILPLMVSCILATSLVHLVMGGSLYSRKLREPALVLRRDDEPVADRSPADLANAKEQ